jgi:hypothetical protein
MGTPATKAMDTVDTAGAMRDEQVRSPHERTALSGALTGRLAVPAHHAPIAMALLGLLAAAFAVQLLGVFRRNINWDEFLFLSQVHAVANGDPIGLLQTSFAHLFGWLTRIDGNEIAQVTVARLVHLVVWAGSLALLYRLGRQLVDPLAALAGIVLFALFSFSLNHAASFRIDGLVLPVLLGVALLLLKPTTARVAAAGALSGVALALTIKAVLWAPAFTGILALGLWQRQRRITPVVAGTIAGLASFAVIMLAHAWWLAAGDAPAPTISAGKLRHTGFRMLLEDGLFPRYEVLKLAVLQNPFTWVFAVAGVALAIAALRHPAARRTSLLLLLLALPVASVAFYANAWPYAYVVLMPTACLLAGLGFQRVFYGGDARRVLAALCLALAALPLVLTAWSLRADEQAPQKQVLAIVHDLFDEPVAYIDKGGMVSSFPRQPVFLSRWGMKAYREAGNPVLASYIRDAHPPLLIVNTALLDVWDEVSPAHHPEFGLFTEDIAALRATYTHYWGEIYLAGRQWSGLGPSSLVSFDIAIPGDYTLLSQGLAIIDGRRHPAGATVPLAAGPHTLTPTTPEPDLRLLWGRNTEIPPEAPSDAPIYTGL